MSFQIEYKKFTAEEFNKMADVGILDSETRYELINGEIITMSPTKSSHAGIVDLLSELLIIKFQNKAIIRGQNPLSLGRLSQPEPDLAIVKTKKNRYFSNHPKPKDIYWVIEVSDTTLEKDQKLKIPMYANAKIAEYWIINIPEKQIEIYRNPKGAKYLKKEIIAADQKAKCTVLDFEIAANDLFLF